MYAHTVTADNATLAPVDLGNMGGMLQSWSLVDGESLVTNLFAGDASEEVTITSTRTRNNGK